jgi:transketolase
MGDFDLRDAAFDSLYDIVKQDENAVFLTADQGSFSLNKLQKDFPSQYYNVGISEQTMINVASGLTLEGKKVFVHAITPFLIERCYEQIKLNLSCMKLPICLMSIGGGVVYNGDGPSHHSINDIAIIRSLPNIAIFSPSDYTSLEWSVRQAGLNNFPSYIRLDKGSYPDIHCNEDLNNGAGFSMIRYYGNDVLFVCTGTIIHDVIELSDEMRKSGPLTGVLDLYDLKDYNVSELSNILSQFCLIVSVEEHSVIGGIGSIVEEVMAKKCFGSILIKMGIQDCFCRYSGDRNWMRHFFGIDKESIRDKLVSYAGR